ncbi:MAG: hypothetical protein JNM56_12635 [Planctomycetia bacterium]|nr:hypothetical protein [Planctomycetia bacterium]
MRVRAWMLSVCVGLAAAATPGRAEQLTLTTSRDNTLIEVPNSGSAQLSNGSGPSLFVGRTNQAAGTARRRGLLFFDLSAIVPGSQINSVTLKLHVTQGLNSAAQPSMELFALLAEFGEAGSFALGGAGDAAQTPDATWFYSQYATSPWTTAGGDFGAASASASVAPGTTVVTWTGAGLVNDVQKWVDGIQDNFGWLLRGNEAQSGSARGFGTRENTNAALRPELTIDYSPPSVVPAPPGLVLMGIGGLGLLLRHRRRGRMATE